MLPSEYYYLTGQPIKLSNGLGTILQPKIIDFINNDIFINTLKSVAYAYRKASNNPCKI